MVVIWIVICSNGNGRSKLREYTLDIKERMNKYEFLFVKNVEVYIYLLRKMELK
jgi:hypothetical protein